jgi:serine/threonine protein phosphatase PrpC
LKAKDFCIAAASRRGRSHEHAGSFRDDDFFIHHDQSTGWSILVVADGAGSSKNSREGSRIAVGSSGKFLVDNLLSDIGLKISVQLPAWDSGSTSQKIIGTELHYLFHKMALQAIKNIEHEAESKNIPFKEYSTTLLAAAVKRDGANTFVATFWIGDGAIAAYGPRGTVKLMGIPDGGEFAGQTRFLDRNTINDQGFSKRVRFGRFLDATAVILLTDGVSDPYFETDSGLLNASNWDLLWDEISPFLKDARPENRLVEWLHFFKQGHHDDRTIAILW